MDEKVQQTSSNLLCVKWSSTPSVFWRESKKLLVEWCLKVSMIIKPTEVIGNYSHKLVGVTEYLIWLHGKIYWYSWGNTTVWTVIGYIWIRFLVLLIPHGWFTFNTSMGKKSKRRRSPSSSSGTDNTRQVVLYDFLWDHVVYDLTD